MRLLVLMLLLLNIALFAYRDYASQSSGPQSAVLAQQVRPQRVKLLSAQEFAQLTERRSPGCLQIGPLSEIDLVRIKENIVAAQAGAALSERRSESGAYIEIRQPNETLSTQLTALAASVPGASMGVCAGGA
jgi:hypothetical protein